MENLQYQHLNIISTPESIHKNGREQHTKNLVQQGGK